MIGFVKHVSIPIKDQDRALKFYTEKLGFVVTTDAPMGEGQHWIELDLPKGNTRIVLCTLENHEDRIGTNQNIIFAADDVKKTYQELKEKGIEFITEPQEQPWGIFAVFKDSENNQFILSSPN